MKEYLEYACFAQFAYRTESEWLNSWLADEFEDVDRISVGGVTAILALSDRARAVVAFRGTDLELDDWRYNIQCGAKVNHMAGGRVHRGFWNELAQVWEPITRRLWQWDESLHREINVDFIGHSKGGALATIAGVQWAAMQNRGRLGHIVTFGAPRVGDAQFVAACERRGYSHRTIRFQNSGDPVPGTPPYVMGYRHHCLPWYFDCSGHLHNPRQAFCLARLWDSLGARLYSLISRGPGSIAQHDMGKYTALVKDHIMGPKL